jgi:uncharacterized protein YraI
MSGASIQIGSRVYLRGCIAGEPGYLAEFDRRGWAGIDWLDMLEAGRTFHRVETLIVDESFAVRQLGFDFEEVAA